MFSVGEKSKVLYLLIVFDSMRLAPLAALLAVVTACGGDDAPDIVGLYRTTEHLANAEGCSGGTTPDPSTPYFRIVEEELFGVAYFTRQDCADTREASCEGAGGLLGEEIANGYTGEVSVSSGDPASCTLGLITYSAILEDDLLTFETYTYSESGAIDPCDTDEALRRGEDMPCESYELIAGTLQ